MAIAQASCHGPDLAVGTDAVLVQKNCKLYNFVVFFFFSQFSSSRTCNARNYYCLLKAVTHRDFLVVKIGAPTHGLMFFKPCALLPLSYNSFSTTLVHTNAFPRNGQMNTHHHQYPNMGPVHRSANPNYSQNNGNSKHNSHHIILTCMNSQTGL